MYCKPDLINAALDYCDDVTAERKRLKDVSTDYIQGWVDYYYTTFRSEVENLFPPRPEITAYKSELEERLQKNEPTP